MNCSNDSNYVLSQINSIREQILEFCNEYPEDYENVHLFGYKCLLKKLQEIEKLILMLKKMPITAQSTPQAVRFHPQTITEADITEKCKIENNSNENIQTHLLLPDDLTPHTKFVLNKIFEKFEKSLYDFQNAARKRYKQALEEAYRKFDCSINLLREKEKVEIRLFIENVLELGIPSTPAAIPNTDLLEAEDLSLQTVCSIDAPLINFEAVKQTLNCSGVEPQMKQQFLSHLRLLNEDLSEIMIQAARRERHVAESNNLNRQTDTNLEHSSELNDDTIFHTIKGQI